MISMHGDHSVQLKKFSLGLKDWASNVKSSHNSHNLMEHSRTQNLTFSLFQKR